MIILIREADLVRIFIDLMDTIDIDWRLRLLDGMKNAHS